MLHHKGVCFIKYNKNYLAARENGKTTLLGFLQKSQAQDVCQHLKTFSFDIKPTKRDSYLLHLETNTVLKKPNMRKKLKIEKKELLESLLFTKLNSVDVAFIDDLEQVDDNIYELKSNYDPSIVIDDFLYKPHMENLYDGNKINYNEYLEEMIQFGIDGIDDDDLMSF
jgi:hypothetical protein